MKGRDVTTKRSNGTTAKSTARMPDRKRRRLAATITLLELDRPRLPVQQDTAAVFDSAAWRERWGGLRPLADAISVYVAGCSGSMALAKSLGVPVWKTGTARDVEERVAGLNTARYGSLTIRDFALHDEAGWSDWQAAKLSAKPTHPASPVRVLPRALLVELPFWLTAQDFEALLVAALEPVTLPFLAARPDGRVLCRRRDVTVDALLRYSRSANGPVLATEIGTVAPSGDASRLLSLIEWLLIRIVLADAGER